MTNETERNLRLGYIILGSIGGVFIGGGVTSGDIAFFHFMMIAWGIGFYLLAMWIVGDDKALTKNHQLMRVLVTLGTIGGGVLGYGMFVNRWPLNAAAFLLGLLVLVFAMAGSLVGKFK